MFWFRKSNPEKVLTKLGTLNATWISSVFRAPGLRVVRLMSSNLGINPFTVCVVSNGVHADTLKLDVNIWDSQRG